MNTTPPKAGSSTSILSRAAQLGLAACLGIVIVGVVGFSHVEAAHNAAHDYRHSMAFPCH
jgi:cobalt transporter subunit CbtB